MSTPALAGRFTDAHLATLAVASCGVGATAALAGGAAMSLPLALAGGGLLALGTTVALAGQWLPPLLALALVLPLPPLYSTEQVRLSSAFAFTVLLVAAWTLRMAAEDRRRAVSTAGLPRRSALLLLAAVAGASAFSQEPLVSLRETANWLLALALLGIAVRELTVAPRLRHTLALALGVTGAIGGLLALLQALGGLPSSFPIAGTPFHRATLGFGWPNELGVFLAVSLPFAVYAISAARTSTTRAAALCGVFAVGLGLLATFSRASWLAVLLAPAVLLVSGSGRLAVRTWLAALLFVVLADVLSGGAIQARIAMTIGDWVVEQRAALTLAGLLMFAAHPLVGVGPGGFAGALEQYGPQIGWLWDYLPTAQNGYIQMAAETGAIGLAALLLFLGTVLRVLLRGARAARGGEEGALRRTALWAFATALLLAFNEWIFAHGLVQLIVLSAALGLAAPRRQPEAA